MATKYTYIYCRISADQQGRREGVQDQERWGRKYADEHWSGIPIKVFADNDLSAAKDDVYRPEFERMRDGIRRGECGNLWVVEQSRLTRKAPEWFNLVTDLVKADVHELHTRRNGVVRLDDVVGDILAVLDAHEVKKLRKRLNDKLAELATQGRPGGGAPIFGYRNSTDDEGRKTREVVPEEAEVIRWAAERVLSGWSLSSVVQNLNGRGHRGRAGARLSYTTVKQWLTSPSVAGLRIYRGEVVATATWEPILDQETWREVCATLRTRVTVRRADNGGAWHRVPRPAPARRLWLLTGGLTVCGHDACGMTMHAFTLRHPPKKDLSYYRCQKNRGGCGRMNIPAVALENHVAAELFDHLDEPEFLAAFSSDENRARRDEIVKALRSIETQRAEWMAARDANQLDLGEYLAAKAKFDEEEHHLQADLADLPAPVERVDPAKTRAAWPRMNLDERHKLVRDFIERVVIHEANGRRLPTRQMVADRAGVSLPTVRAALGTMPNWHVSAGTRDRVLAAAAEVGYRSVAYGRPFDPDRVEIIWRG